MALSFYDRASIWQKKRLSLAKHAPNGIQRFDQFEIFGAHGSVRFPQLCDEKKVFLASQVMFQRRTHDGGDAATASLSCPFDPTLQRRWQLQVEAL
jgi:hypothetical protein